MGLNQENLIMLSPFFFGFLVGVSVYRKKNWLLLIHMKIKFCKVFFYIQYRYENEFSSLKDWDSLFE